MKKAHPGFKKVAAGIAAKEGVSKKAAGAILASAARKASPAAKKANPRLKNVKAKGDSMDKGANSTPAQMMKTAMKMPKPGQVIENAKKWM